MTHTEEQVNELLRKGLKLYFKLNKQGNTEEANEALKLTSMVANLELNASGIREAYRETELNDRGILELEGPFPTEAN